MGALKKAIAAVTKKTAPDDLPSEPVAAESKEEVDVSNLPHCTQQVLKAQQEKSK